MDNRARKGSNDPSFRNENSGKPGSEANNGYAGGPPGKPSGQAHRHRHRDGHDDEVRCMLGDDEALEGIEAWLRHQPLGFDLRALDTGRAAAIRVESPAGWLLRLVRHARGALVR